MSSQDVMTTKEAGNNFWIVSCMWTASLSSRTRARDQFSSLSLSTGKTPPYRHMLVVSPAFYISTCNLPGDPHGRFRSNKLANSSLPCEPIDRWEDDIKMCLQEMGCGDMDWIDLAQDNDRWWALVHAVMNLRFNNIRGISWVAETLLARHGGLCYV